MHELALTQDLVDAVAERTVGRRVLVVRLRVGRLSAVVPEAMTFSFDVVTAGTPLEGAVLVIEHVDGAIDCRTCGRRTAVTDRFTPCPCGSDEVVVAAGEDLTLASVELEKEPAPCA